MPAHKMKSIGRDDHLVIADYWVDSASFIPQGAVAIGVRLRRYFPVLRWWRRVPIQKLVYNFFKCRAVRRMKS